MNLGCCYYPEHWPEDMWADDARRMKELGLSLVRIGEFAWSRIEPESGTFDWGWLDRAVETLADARLQIIMGTPTATPPKWLIDAYPDVLPLDEHGRPRNFGSRRHYCFSSEAYQRESDRIVEAIAKHYGGHPAIVMWQTDNEFGCHNTVVSYSENAKGAFRNWLAQKYQSPDALNTAWGNVFWSMEYRSFDEVDPPAAAVTETNPAHRMDWQRFSSDQVAAFHARQAKIIRKHAPRTDITHNFMGHFTEFDHHVFGKEDLDIATWDSYPLGFLEQAWWSNEVKAKYTRTGHPDFAAFHHDLYRGLCQDGRWGIMEQQPGPVNWARWNPAPLPGMVKLWTLEAAAHGAELVSYFRWRQAPFAQEQMHAGLNRPDNAADVASHEAAAALEALETCGEFSSSTAADVALVYDYEAEWALRIQPQGKDYRYSELAFAFYTALRRKGMNVDIVSPEASLNDCRLIVVPGNPMLGALDVGKQTQVVIGPRSGSKTPDFQIPETLPPGCLQDLISLKVARVESLRPGVQIKGQVGDKMFAATRWREFVETDANCIAATGDGHGVAWQHENVTYLGVWPDDVLLENLISRAALAAGLKPVACPEGLRIRRRGDLVFAFNYGEEVDLIQTGAAKPDAHFLHGHAKLLRADVAIWKDN